MKKNHILLTAFLLMAFACSEKSTSSESNGESSEIQSDKINTPTKNEGISPVLDAYLTVKNNLVNDNAQGANETSKDLQRALEELDLAQMAGDEIEELERLQSDAIAFTKNLESTEIAVQRENFQALSMLIKDMVELVGTDRTLYHQYCPMYKNNTGGMWLSDQEEIRNPLFGSAMLACGSVEETFVSN